MSGFDLIGQLLDGRYRVESRLGAGGMATVYLARQETLKRNVVVKVVSQIRARPMDKENIYDKIFFDFKPLEWGCLHDLPDPVETVIWSSKTPTK